MSLHPSLHSRKSGHDNHHMPDPSHSNPCKRQCPEQRSLQLEGTSQRFSKRLKISHPESSQLPEAFWDNLSKIWLTKRTLREFDRRNSQVSPSRSRSSHRSLHLPVTRHSFAERKNIVQPSQSATDFLRRCTPTDLKDIKLFARHGGPDLADVRGCQIPLNPLNCMTSSGQTSSRGRKQGSIPMSNTKPTTNTTKSTGPYDRAFQQNLTDGGVYPDEYEYPNGRIPPRPDNWKEINDKLASFRRSLSPSQFSDGKFRNFKRANAHALKEKQVSQTVIPVIEGKIEDLKCRSGGIPFTNLDHLTDGTLVPGNPDVYYGARPEQLDRQVRNELAGRIVPSTQHDLPIAPNFFLAAKGPTGLLAVAENQACYDGALGARGMQILQSYEQNESVYDNNAYTITSIYHGGTLKMYTSHLSRSSNPGNRPECYMNQINSWGMDGNPETFRQGATAYRNARDWTKEQRDKAINQANERANHIHAHVPAISASFSIASSFATEASLDEPYTIEPLSQRSFTSLNEDSHVDCDSQESETSTDELAVDPQLPAKRSSRHSKRSSQRKRRAAGKSSDAGHSHVSAVALVLKSFAAIEERSQQSEDTTQQSEDTTQQSKGTTQQSEGTTQQSEGTTQQSEGTNQQSEGTTQQSEDTTQRSEGWIWTNSGFQFRQGNKVMKVQSETPADVWVYYDQGWPGQGGKKWRHWISTTREILYS